MYPLKSIISISKTLCLFFPFDFFPNFFSRFLILLKSSSGLKLMLYLYVNSTTLLKKIGPELNGIGLVIHILDFFLVLTLVTLI